MELELELELDLELEKCKVGQVGGAFLCIAWLATCLTLAYHGNAMDPLLAAVLLFLAFVSLVVGIMPAIRSCKRFYRRCRRAAQRGRSAQ